MSLHIKKIKIEYMEHPLALKCRRPRFSWQLQNDHGGVEQVAYQIIVKVQEQLVWDSGKITSEESQNIVYEGEALRPLERYQCYVTCWDACEQSETQATWFETSREGISWVARWVEPEQEPTEKKEPNESGTNLIGHQQQDNRSNFRPVQFMRLKITARQEPLRAYIFASAHGVYRLELNGERVGSHEFAPEITPYDTMLQYQTYDVSGRLQAGNNVIGTALGDGWWIGRVGLSGDCCQFGTTTGLLLEVRLQYADGSWEVFTGKDCVSSVGPIVFSDIFVGEKYDARLEQTGWSQTDYDDSSWKPVHLLEELSLDNLMPQQGPSVAPVNVFKPERILTTPKGDTVLDLGQNIAGRIELSMNAPAGVEITLEHSEVLDKDGNFINNIMGVYKDQKDTYITKEGFQTYQPWFTYHGFRFVKITGWPGEISVDNFKAVVLSSDMEEMCSFKTSNGKLNQLQQNIYWSQVANMLSIPTDCPQRERAGWTGDIFAFAPTAAWNQDVHAFLSRWLEECRHSQLTAGEVPMIVPYLPGYRSIEETAKTPTSCGWGDAILQVPWSLYMAYGDLRVLEDNYEAMKKWMNYEEERVTNHQPLDFKRYSKERKSRSRLLWNTDFHYGDWLIPSVMMSEDADASSMAATALCTMFQVGPAYFAYSTSKMAEIACVLGHKKDAIYYEDLNRKVRRAFVEEFVHEDGTMDADFQGIYVIALQMGLVTEDIRPKMVAHLCKLIRENGNRLDTGFLSIPFLMDVLCKNGRRDVAFDLLYQEQCPSWLYEVNCGATTMWEAWAAILPDGTVGNASYNHYAFGCVGDWIYREVVGLTPTEPGFCRVFVRPGLDSRLTSAFLRHETPYGDITVDWKIEEERVHLRVEIPVGVTAEIAIPDCALVNHQKGRVQGRRYYAESGSYECVYPLDAGQELCREYAVRATAGISDKNLCYAPICTKSKRITGNTTMGELFADKGAMDILQKLAPELANNPLGKKAPSMTIEQLMTFQLLPQKTYDILLILLRFGSWKSRIFS